MKSYEQIGDIIILTIPKEYQELKDFIGKSFYDSFGCQTVLEKGSVSGEFRVPYYKKIIGGGFVTIHKENGILYKIDLSKSHVFIWQYSREDKDGPSFFS